MTCTPARLKRLLHDRSGVTIVEAGFLAPIVIGLMIATLQVGFALQAYNAIRGVSSDAARYAIVEYQKGQSPTNAQIRSYAIDVAAGAEYLLREDDLTVSVTDATNQRVASAREISISLSYEVPAFLPLFNWISPTVNYERPIFVLT